MIQINNPVTTPEMTIGGFKNYFNKMKRLNFGSLDTAMELIGMISTAIEPLKIKIEGNATIYESLDEQLYIMQPETINGNDAAVITIGYTAIGKFINEHRKG